MGKESETLLPPGVPTTCHAVSNVKTKTSWAYESFADSTGTATAEQPGDGSVPVSSSIGPCKRWRDVELMASNTSNIGYIAESIAGAEGRSLFHKEALLDTGWLATLFKMFRLATTHSVL